MIERFRASGGGWQARMNSFLASNQAVLEMIETYEESILDLETLTEMFDRGELRAAHEGTGQAIARVKANIGITRKTVQTLREQLAWSKS